MCKRLLLCALCVCVLMHACLNRFFFFKKTVGRTFTLAPKLAPVRALVCLPASTFVFGGVSSPVYVSRASHRVHGHAPRGTALVHFSSSHSLKVHSFSSPSLLHPSCPPPPTGRQAKEARDEGSRLAPSTMPSLADAYTSAFRKKSATMPMAR